MELNPIVELGLICQKHFSKNMTCYVISVDTSNPRPVITVSIHLPNRQKCRGVGGNKKQAKRNAAAEILSNLDAFLNP